MTVIDEEVRELWEASDELDGCSDEAERRGHTKMSIDFASAAQEARAEARLFALGNVAPDMLTALHAIEPLLAAASKDEALVACMKARDIALAAIAQAKEAMKRPTSPNLGENMPTPASSDADPLPF
jgi:hypothetical protein